MTDVQINLDQVLDAYDRKAGAIIASLLRDAVLSELRAQAQLSDNGDND